MRIFSVLILAFFCLGLKYSDFDLLPATEQCRYKSWVYEQGALFRNLGFQRAIGDEPVEEYDEWAKTHSTFVNEKMFIFGWRDGDDLMRDMWERLTIRGWDEANKIYMEQGKLSGTQILILKRNIVMECYGNINNRPKKKPAAPLTDV